ncbi:hypothetical protein H8959_017166, partial [Pygathrix nigripes]
KFPRITCVSSVGRPGEPRRPWCGILRADFCLVFPTLSLEKSEKSRAEGAPDTIHGRAVELG